MKNKPTIILASQSPRRKQLLQQIGISPICQPVGIDESVLAGETPTTYCQRMAIEKAQKAWNNSDKKIAVLGADTIIAFAGEILGKPRDQQHAYEMLMKLSGHSHQVITVIAMINSQKHKTVESNSTVEFIELAEQAVKSYIQTKEPMDKAGSYAIQGEAAQWIRHISGSYSSIMGLPLCETAQLIQEFT